MRYQFTKLQRITILWFIFFTLSCLINSFVVFKYVRSDETAFTAAFLPPFIHCGIIVVCYLGFGIRRWIFGIINNDEQYIKVNHPQIWKKLHPWGDCSQNSFGHLGFIAGNYDDGTDERLAEIKRKFNVNIILLLYPFVLTLWIWLLNVFLIILFGLFAEVANR